MLFVSTGSDDVYALWRMRPDGSGARKLIEFSQGTYGGVAWSPDGGTPFYSTVVNGSAQLFSIPSGGGSPRQLSHEIGLLLHPTASPDGRWIAATRLTHATTIVETFAR